MVNRTAKDGKTTIEALDIDGRSYDLPPWISEQEFRTALNSSDPNEPLSHLASLKLSGWRTSPWGFQEPQVPIFDAVFEVPIGGIYELVLNRFVPAWEDSDLDREIEVIGDKIRVSFPVAEYMDFNDIQLISFPKRLPIDFVADYEWHQDLFDELALNMEAVKRDVVGWNGYYEEFVHNGTPYFLMLKVHED